MTDEQPGLLEDTISEWKRGCHIATDMAWGKCNAKSDVQPSRFTAHPEGFEVEFMDKLNPQSAEGA